MPSSTSIPIIVQGNSFSLAIPLQIYVISEGSMVLQDYTPDPTDQVSIQLKGSRRQYTYAPTITGNTAFIDLSGNEMADNYGVVVSIVKADGTRLRSFRTDQFFIVESSDDLTPNDIIEGLENNVIYLNSQAFVAGEDGRGIDSIVKTSTSGLVDTYTITYTDATTSTFTVTNGANGQAGAQGQDGVGITSIAKTATVGLVDTYTITLTNGETTTFQVTNGMDGVDLGLANIVDNLTTGGSTNVLSAEQGKILADGMDKAFENWKASGSSEDEVLYQGTAANFKLLASTALINEGDHIQLKVENGSGTYTFYIYYTTATNPKSVLGSVTDSGVIDIPSFSYNGYPSYDRVYAQGNTAAKFTLIRKASTPAVEISFTDTLTEQIDDMIQDAIGSISLDNYDSAKEEPIAEGLTDTTNILKTAIDVNVGDYIKVVAGAGTTGTWALAKYDNQSTLGKMIYFEDLAPNETRFVKILTDYYRLYFYKVNSCDAPLSVYKACPLKSELLEFEENVEDYSKYYDKGNAPKTFSQAPCIIVAGQSNADGRVPAADLPLYISLPDSSVKVWSGSAFADLSTSYFSQDRWAFDIVTAHYLGLIGQCYFVKYAKGSTHLHKLGTPNEEAWSADYEGLTTSLLRILEDRVRGAVASQQPFNIRAMLWHQGEGDYSPATVSKYYYKDLKKFIAYIRGICGNERLPFISGTISHLSGQYSAIVEEAQLKVAAEDPYVTYIDMSGAPLLDTYHFNAASSEYLGKMMYDTLIDYGVISGQKLAPTRPW